MQNKAILIYTTISSEDSAKKFAKKALFEKVVSCINIIPSISSIYFWDGKVSEENESIVLLKTTKERCDCVVDWIKKNHPYENPAILYFTADTTPAFFEFLSKV